MINIDREVPGGGCGLCGHRRQRRHPRHPPGPALGTWIPGQQHRLRRLAPGTWHQALASVLAVSPGRPDDRPGHPVIEIAIYPDVVWLAAYSLRTPRR